MIFNEPQAPIQSIWRWPCITTARPASGFQPALEPAAVDQCGADAFQNAFTGIGYSTTWWCNATIQRAAG